MQSLYPGQGFTAYTDFDNTLEGPPHYELRRASDLALVQEGMAQQDGDNPARWTVPIVLPEDLTPGVYTLLWLGQKDDHSYQNREQITVLQEKSEYVEIDRLFRAEQPLADALLVEETDTVEIEYVRILDTNGTLQAMQNTADEVFNAGERFYQATFPDGLAVGQSAFACYIIEWNFTLNGAATTEYHFVYIVNYKVLAYVNELRRMIDKAALRHKNPALRWNDVDLVAFLNLGLQKINSSPPTQTSYNFNSVPDNLMSYVLAAAAIEALNSRFLAEGEAAFNFSGSPVSLDVDRTGMIESAISHYTATLEDLKSVKKGIVMSTGGSGTGGRLGSSAGILVFSNSPMLDTSTSLGLAYLEFQPGNRAIFYDSILANL